MKDIFKVAKRRKGDMLQLKQWLDSGLKLPPPEAVKYRKIIDRKQLRKIKHIYTNLVYINSRQVLLNADFSEVLDLSSLGSTKHEKALIWLNQDNVNSITFYSLIENIFKHIEAPEILIDGAKQMMQKDAEVSLWDLKQVITSKYPAYFYHSHNDIVTISPCL